MNFQDWFPSGLTGLSPCSLRDPQNSSPTPQFKGINSLVLSLLYGLTLTSIHDYWNIIALTRWSFVSKVMSLLFNMLSRLVIAFLARSKCLLTSWWQSPSAVILEPKKIKSLTLSIVSLSFAMKWWDRRPWSTFSECWVLSQLFTLLFHFHEEALSSSSLSAIRTVSSAYLRLLIFLPAILIPAWASFSLAFPMTYSA